MGRFPTVEAGGKVGLQFENQQERERSVRCLDTLHKFVGDGRQAWFLPHAEISALNRRELELLELGHDGSKGLSSAKQLLLVCLEKCACWI